MKRHPTLQQIIVVGSGKGGVGKSTVAVNLALALARPDERGRPPTVGLLDADIYGPSFPLMLGATERVTLHEGKFQPIVRHGLPTMSMGYLIDPATPMIWRGPLLAKAIDQLLFDTAWPALDYLVVDLPPGTGDVPLSLAQRVLISGAIVVTTPQDVALLDVRKAIAMFQRVKIPILGVIENMSGHTCKTCGHRDAIFGRGGGDHIAQEFGVALLGTLPLDSAVREQMDRGTPPVVADPAGEITGLYRDIARLLTRAAVHAL